MLHNTITRFLGASALCLTTLSPISATAGDGLFTIPLGEDTDLCVGVWSCLFNEAPPDDGRDDDGVADHRSADAAGQGAGGTDPNIRDHRTTTSVRDHRDSPDTPKNEVVPVSIDKFDCPAGKRKLRQMGYRSIVPYDCEGGTYHYTAQNGGSLFRAAFKAYSGDIDITFIGLAN